MILNNYYFNKNSLKFFEILYLFLFNLYLQMKTYCDENVSL
jgi:hypothetical protein